MLQSRDAQPRTMLLLMLTFISLSDSQWTSNLSSLSSTSLELVDLTNSWQLRLKRTWEPSSIVFGYLKFSTWSQIWLTLWCKIWILSSSLMESNLSNAMLLMSSSTLNLSVLSRRRQDLRLSSRIIKRSKKTKSSLWIMKSSKSSQTFRESTRESFMNSSRRSLEQRLIRNKRNLTPTQTKRSPRPRQRNTLPFLSPMLRVSKKLLWIKFKPQWSLK